LVLEVLSSEQLLRCWAFAFHHMLIYLHEHDGLVLKNVEKDNP